MLKSNQVIAKIGSIIRKIASSRTRKANELPGQNFKLRGIAMSPTAAVDEAFLTAHDSEVGG